MYWPPPSHRKKLEQIIPDVGLSLTASYVGAIFLLFPALNILVILCTLYCIYALYTGIPAMKKTAADKQVGYLAVIILITVVAMILVGLIQAEIMKVVNRPATPNLRFFQ